MQLLQQILLVLAVGLVFYGRQSPGGQNVVWGLHEALKIHNPKRCSAWISRWLRFIGTKQGSNQNHRTSKFCNGSMQGFEVGCLSDCWRISIKRRGERSRNGATRCVFPDLLTL
ncbi:hypothetical protein HanPI659440_Chr15g0576341 [Helianthus annuus]|nr:hypothetical protein HanPI659440_Chr15g0576341 [Helianthus annuus]